MPPKRRRNTYAATRYARPYKRKYQSTAGYKGYGGGGTRGRTLFRRRMGAGRFAYRKGGKARLSAARYYTRPGRRVARPFRSPSNQAATAFRTNTVYKYNSSIYSIIKGIAQTKTTILLKNLDPADVDTVFLSYDAMTLPGGSPSPDYMGLRNFKTTLYIKNLASYQIRVRVMTWVCRHDLQRISPSDILAPDIVDITTLDDLFTKGFLAPFVSGVGNDTAQDPSRFDVSLTPFANRLWRYYFRMVKTKTYMLMPFRTRREVIHSLKRKPARLDRWGMGLGQNQNPMFQPASPPDYGAPYFNMAFQRAGGATTCVKTIELVGETINDDTAYPDTEIFNAPTVISTQLKVEFESCEMKTQNIQFGDDDQAVSPDQGRTGQPWNYLVFANTNSTGVSSVAGALTSGL